MDKNLPANTQDTSSIPGPGGFHVLSWCSGTREPQLLSLCAATAEAQAPRPYALQQERPWQ